VVCVGEAELCHFRDGAIQDSDLIPFRRCEISSASHTDSVRLECNFDPWPGELKKDASPKVLLTSGYTARALTGTHRFGSIFWVSSNHFVASSSRRTFEWESGGEAAVLGRALKRRGSDHNGPVVVM
jgi:hypothetical protein